MKPVRMIVGAILLLGSMTTWADLQYSFNGDVLRVWGTAEVGDVDGFKDKLTPAIKTVVVGNINGGDWVVGRDLGALVAKAGVTTVVHGNCYGWVCPMIFLSGKSRMFSGAGRAAVHQLELPIIPLLGNYTCWGINCSTVMEWFRQRTRLSDADMAIYHKSLFVATNDSNPDYLHFFPDGAGFSHGDALHCAGETIAEKKGDFLLADCVPMKDATALNKGIVTTDERFVHPGLTIKADIAVPPPSGYARIEDLPDASLGLVGECNAVYRRFLRADAPKAFVLSRTGSCNATDAQAFRPYAQALDNCVRSKGVKNCRFYAVDDNVVFVPFDPFKMTTESSPAPGL
jgi:hypothetical protein